MSGGLFPWEDENGGEEPTAEGEGGEAGDGGETDGGEDVGDGPRGHSRERAHSGEGEGEAVAAAPAADEGRGQGRGRPVVRKEYYSISEVADLVGLPAHVLRYWESQFSVLNPSKNRSGNRVYQRKEIRLILLVKQLLHDEKYTVEGAKQKLEQLRRGGGIGAAAARALDEQLVQVLREDLLTLARVLRTDAG